MWTFTMFLTKTSQQIINLLVQLNKSKMVAISIGCVLRWQALFQIVLPVSKYLWTVRNTDKVMIKGVKWYINRWIAVITSWWSYWSWNCTRDIQPDTGPEATLWPTKPFGYRVLIVKQTRLCKVFAYSLRKK